MSTTGAVTAAITLTDFDLDPYITHAPTRHWLTGPGLPCASDLLTFERLRTDGLRTVADTTADPGFLTAELRDRLVVGGLLTPGGRAGESLLLDGATGAITTAYFSFDLPATSPTPAAPAAPATPAPAAPAPRPLAPSLRALVTFAAATEELAELRGRFAAFAGRHGTKAAQEASRQLLAVFEEGSEGSEGALAPYWKMAALIRPLALVAGPGTRSGLTLDLPARLLEGEFGPGRLAHFEDVDCPAPLTHEPTRRFLRETGLPEDGTLFTLDTDVRLPTLAEYYADEYEGGLPADALPPRADCLIRLGRLVDDHALLVDGATGEVLAWSEREATLSPLNTDVSTLAFTLWLLHRERAIDRELSHELTTDAYDQLAATMIRVLRSVDPAGSPHHPVDWEYWTRLFQDESAGVL
ncbi:SUKH-4 family immunity protein [Streptomyces sp. NPDC093252]|uniref:SUKH-4 family immunity protein n=1 Tax=Streptomyces sp. NPDC093252 TaxID=3154980 RepID=UPI003422D477